MGQIFFTGEGDHLSENEGRQKKGKENQQRCKEEAIRDVQWKPRSFLDIKEGARKTHSNGVDLHCPMW